MDNVFNRELLKERIKEIGKSKPEYFIGIDTYDSESLTYCLSMKFGESNNIILLKTMRDRQDFDEEVKNLAKYFDAVIIKSITE